MQIRPVAATDLPGIAAIKNKYLGTGTLTLDPLRADDFMGFLPTKTVEPGKINRYLMLVAAVTAGDLLGYASVNPWSNRRGYVLAGEVSIFLHPAHTGKGIGGKLYDALFPEAYKLGYRYLAARIMAANQGSIDFHIRRGFKVVGTQRRVGLINGKRVDNTLLEMHLD